MTDSFFTVFGQGRGSRSNASPAESAQSAPPAVISPDAPLSEDAFWAFNARYSHLPNLQRVKALEDGLVALGAARVAEWDAFFCDYKRRLWRDGVYEAANDAIGSVGSDDGFGDFCSWAVTCGREFVEALLADPVAAFKRRPLPVGAEPFGMEPLSYVTMHAEDRLGVA